VIGTGVECPSLSPDNQLNAFKKREMRRGVLTWRLAIFELATGHERVLEAETRSVDDQVAWLNDRQIAYSTPDPNEPGSMIVSVLPVDGSGPPRELIPQAYSPAIGLL
jgi:hypothetical protein